MRIKNVERTSSARLILVLTLLLWLVSTLPSEAMAHLGKASDAPNGSDRADVMSARAPPPIFIQIDAAGVNGPVETREIVDGGLDAPSGPWVVAWYLQSAR